MRNLHVLNDLINVIPTQYLPCQDAVGFAIDYSSGGIYVITLDGIIIPFNLSSLHIENFHELKHCIESVSWFSIDYIPEINSLVVISHDGGIESISLSSDRDSKDVNKFEEIGCVEGGISCASWSPDQNNLIIVTNNNTLLSMNCNWDDVSEISIPTRILPSKSSISWAPDGEVFALITKVETDQMYVLSIYSKSLQLLSKGQGIAKTSPSVVRGLEPVSTWLFNSSMIGIAQRKPYGSPRVSSSYV